MKKSEEKRFVLFGRPLGNRNIIKNKLLSLSNSFYVVYRQLLFAQNTGKYKNLQIYDRETDSKIFII